MLTDPHFGSAAGAARVRRRRPGSSTHLSYTYRSYTMAVAGSGAADMDWVLWCPAEWWCPACADVALPPPRDAAAWGGAAAAVAGNGAADMEWVPAAYSKKSQQASDEKPRPKVSGWLEYCRKAGNP